MVLDCRVRQAEAVGGRLLRPGGQDRGDPDALDPSLERELLGC
jgi:hypothetical protein